MSLTDAQIVELSAEITNDPETLGLTALATRADFDQIAPILNDATLGVGTIEPEFTNVTNVAGAVVESEFTALTAGQQRLWHTLISGASANAQIETSGAGIKSLIQDIWGVGTTTRANLLALQSRDASRAEILWGENVVVDNLDVAKAIWGDAR